VINLSLRPFFSRLAALFVSVVTISITSIGAAAAQPEAWNQPEPVSGLHYVVLFVIAPVGSAAVIALLAWLPSLKKSSTSSD
jgi:hypothetical protein